MQPSQIPLPPTITHPIAFPLATKRLLVPRPLSPPIACLVAFALALKRSSRALPLSLPITDLVALVLVPKCLPIAFRLFSPIINLRNALHRRPIRPSLLLCNALSAPFLPPLTICLPSPHPVVPLYPPILSFLRSTLPSRLSSSLPSHPVVPPLFLPIPSFFSSPLPSRRSPSPLLSRQPPCPRSLLFAVDQSTDFASFCLCALDFACVCAVFCIWELL
ncbi:unnamed protein product [Closterium sp. NIES-65]|nr:unnamed protein product [Closterium sp. NIES-65]CAI6005181.1 unnamed protein product [Closterium sp. NIES-65]